MNRFFIAAATLLLIASVSATNAFAGGTTAVTECGAVLSERGKYELTQNLVNCPGASFFPSRRGAITIASSGVKLNLKGHKITCGEPHDLPGILVEHNLSHVHIKNGTVEGCMVGVELEATSHSKVTNMTVSDSRLNPGSELFFSGTGVFIFEGVNNTIERNRLLDNENRGIWMLGNDRHRIRKNIANGNGVIGIEAVLGQKTKLTCNQANLNITAGIILADIGGGNVVRGNVANNNGLAGISMLGLGMAGPPSVVVVPIPEGNRINRNSALHNGIDMVEAMFDQAEGIPFLVDDLCRNTWKKNRFSMKFGPDTSMCIGDPVELDDDDVCALDDDDASDDN